MSLQFLSEMTPYRLFLDAVKGDSSGQEVSGLIEPAKPLFLAQLLLDLRKSGSGGADKKRGSSACRRPVVVIRSSTSPLSGFAEQVRFFWRELAKKTPAASPGPPSVAVLPPLSKNPYLEVPHSLDAVSSRMYYFRRLLRRSPALTITTPAGLLKPIPGTSSLSKAFLRLEEEGRLDRDRLIGWLRMSGYSRQDLVNAHGEFAWRGGIVDVFSPWEERPFRIEVGAEHIVSLRSFDPSSQRSFTRKQDLEIPALQEFPGSDKFLAEWENLARVKARSGGWDDLIAKIERLKDGDIFPSFSYLALIYGERFQSPLSLLENPLFILDGAGEVNQDWEETLKDLNEQAEDLSAQKRFILKPDEIFSREIWDSISRQAVLFTDIGGGREAFSRNAKGEGPGQAEGKKSETYSANSESIGQSPSEGRLGQSEGQSGAIHFPFQSVPQFENRIPFFSEIPQTHVGGQGDLCNLFCQRGRPCQAGGAA